MLGLTHLQSRCSHWPVSNRSRESKVLSRAWRHDLGRLHSRLTFPRFSVTMRRQARSARDRDKIPWFFLRIFLVPRHTLHSSRYNAVLPRTSRTATVNHTSSFTLSPGFKMCGWPERLLAPRGSRLRSIRYPQPLPFPLNSSQHTRDALVLSVEARGVSGASREAASQPAGMYLGFTRASRHMSPAQCSGQWPLRSGGCATFF